jgi:2-polyprenyl-3-methyl-5-hydroxy-6-metoxy-1,4-benzoquinol methylase
MLSDANRLIQPELLDTLPPESTDARRSRRDLRVINWLMGNHRWIIRSVQPRLRHQERLVEIGAGSGELCQKLAGRGIAAAGLDRWPGPALPSSLVWHQADLRTFTGYADYQAVVANLVLHHLSDTELCQLGRKLNGGPRIICACEPTRRRLSQRLFSALGPVLGANSVTRHDALVSIAAGFLGDELPTALGLDNATWSIRCTQTLLGGYRMLASKRT